MRRIRQGKNCLERKNKQVIRIEDETEADFTKKKAAIKIFI